MLTQSYLKLPDLSDTQDQVEGDNGDRLWFSFRYQMELPEEGYVETKAALKELVDLRNRYGCGSWHNVIHESQHFEVRKESLANNGLRQFGIAVV
ncbi:hypothetical protein ALP12_200084 [Pseudomonas savastanoi pv. phaseolicola]|uniref:hypothetical protein n=1 Tax=Pseudomonas savastanoi TaxID=29438 RepID=UPI0006B9D6CB|nr:hypothetical protein [Pseudomonas savastanoi]KPB42606.1 hypothetical protein AC515_0118 [Pseudomonas savastanoi pv. phaseolicola]RMV32787.1 hypothetical protein ALP12_200084 [Pseudomonas savastanoi pv. phaseolicola]